MQNILVVIALVLQMLCSNGANTANADSQNVNWLQVMALMGGNSYVNWYQDASSEVDYTIDLGEGQWEQYGYGKGSKVRIHGNLNNGLYFDFSGEGNQWDQTQQISNPIEGITITQRTYNDSSSGYSYSVGPISWQTAVNLWKMASTQMAS